MLVQSSLFWKRWLRGWRWQEPSLWGREDVWLRLTKVSSCNSALGSGLAVSWRECGSRGKEIPASLTACIEVFWRSWRRGTKERSRVLDSESTSTFLFPVTLALGDLWIWKSLSGSYYFVFYPFVLKSFPTCLVWWNLWELGFYNKQI